MWDWAVPDCGAPSQVAAVGTMEVNTGFVSWSWKRPCGPVALSTHSSGTECRRGRGCVGARTCVPWSVTGHLPHSRERVQRPDLRVGCSFSLGARAPGARAGSGRGREHPRLIFSILSARTQGGAQSDEGLWKRLRALEAVTPSRKI